MEHSKHTKLKEQDAHEVKKVKKLTKWKSEPSVQDLRNDLSEGLSQYNEHVADVNTWLDNLNTKGISKNPVKNQTKEPRSTIEPQLIKKHAEWRYPSLSEPLHTAPALFSVKPVSAEDTAIAHQDTALLDHQFNMDINKVKLIDTVVRTGVDEGTWVFKIGWEFTSTMGKEEIPAVSNGQVIGVATRDVEIPVSSKPSVEVLDFDAVIIDPNARGDINNANYVIYKYPSSILKLKAAGKFDNLDSLVNTESVEFGEQKAFDTNPENHKRKEFDVYEWWGYWDINDDDVLSPIVATFVGDVMIRLADNPFPDRKLPFVLGQLMPVRNENYGEPDGELLKDAQRLNGAITRGIVDLLGKSANGQIGYQANALDAANMLRMQRGDKYFFRAGINPAEIAYQHTYPEIPQSALTMLQMQQSEAESLTGVNTFGQGVSGASLGDGSAAAATGALNSAAKRESGMLRRIAKSLEEVASKIVLMNHVFLEPEFVEKITGEPYVEPRYDTETIDVRVEIRTAERDAKDAENLAFMIQTVGNNLDPALTQIMISDIAKLHGQPAIAKSIASFQPQPDPLAQEEQALKIELLKMQIENEGAKAQWHGSKVGSEQEKARKLGAEADKTNLEFIEEETGTNHERALAIQEAQARANMHLKALDMELNEISESRKPKTKSSK